ncbi:plexin-A4-like [Apostichopus japonicus]|uniref:plexin-A4-like n=1 Tax=Stichopus japonicus TaxID=307972 RepID=UPI003AB77B17
MIHMTLKVTPYVYEQRYLDAAFRTKISNKLLLPKRCTTILRSHCWKSTKMFNVPTEIYNVDTREMLNLHSVLLDICILSLLSSNVQAVKSQNYHTFQIPNSNSVFQNQFLDPRDGSLYIGGLNYIYKLNSDLHLIQSEQTGPVDDSPECRPPPFSCSEPKTTTDNYNKVILVLQNSLITCGSIYQGTCRIRDPGSLNVTYGDSKREVVPNTPSGLAVAFIANRVTERVLYVASSYGDWLRDVPTVSARLISRSPPDDQLFKVTSDEVTHAEIPISRTVLDGSPAVQPFNISYIYGFTSGQFSYFAASQPRDFSTISRYTSKLVRLCHGDPDFNSYIELPLVCAGMNEDDDYNLIQSAHLASLSLDGDEVKDVLVASFSKSESLTSPTPSSESAICIYSVDDINQAFYDRRIHCTKQGSDNTEISWAGSTACSDTEPLFDFISQSSPADYCHTFEIQSPLGGDNRAIIISARPVYESTNYITAVAAVQHLETPIIFIGGNSGNIKKLRLDGSSAEVYESLDLHETPVIRNGLLLSEDREFIFITSEDQITKVPVEECHKFTTCEECHMAEDPYCGWCSLQTECTRRTDSQCQGSQNGTSLRWLSGEDDCLEITGVTPKFAHAGTTTKLTVVVSNLPNISNGSLTFTFLEGATLHRSQPVIIMADISTFTCNTPVNFTVKNTGFLTVELLLLYEENEQTHTIASVPFEFYDCAIISFCSECAGNKYGCKWCLHSNQCIDEAQSCSKSDYITTRTSCPLIRRTEEVLIPAGQSQELQFEGINLPNNTFQFSCQIQYTGLQRHIIPASIVDDQIRCQTNLYNYSSTAESISGSVIIFWGNFPIDMEGNLTVTINKCNRMAVTILDGESKQTCGMCLIVDQRYGCSWCPSMNDCLSLVDSHTCPTNELLEQGNTCPNPTITSFFPTSGHVSGGTRIAIHGYNLGFAPSDITTVSVAGILCTDSEYNSPQLLYCTTGSTLQILSGKVVVRFSNNQLLPAQSEQTFSYVRPRVLFVYPARGPRSGGTRLVIRGRKLDSGLTRTVMISTAPCVPGDGYSCKIEENNSDEIICRTGSASVTDNLLLSVNFDLGCEYNGDTFAYLGDPIVDSFDRLSSIASGGLDLPILGESFDIIQTARLEVRIGSDTVSGDCSNCSDSTMKLICKSPNISVAQTDYPLLLPTSNFSLYMDGVTRYINFGMFFPGSLKTAFEFVEDPVYYLLPSAENIIKVPNEFQGQYNITIQGDNLTLASNSEDVSVIIGGKACFVSNLFINYLICQSPKLSEGVHQVQVQHGNLNFVVGHVEYLGPDQTLALPILIIVILPCALTVVLFCFCLLVLYHLKATNRCSLSVLHTYYYKDSRQKSRKTGMNDDNVSDHTYCSLSISSTAATDAQPPTLPERNRAKELFQLKSRFQLILENPAQRKSGPDISLETGKEQQLPIHPKRNMSRVIEETHESDRKQQRPTISEEDDEYSKRIYNDHCVSTPVDNLNEDAAAKSLTQVEEVKNNPYSHHIQSNNSRHTTGD